MPTLTDLPREVIRCIATHIYDPLHLTQQDRLTWGIFSTVDMHQERQDDLISLVNFGSVCRKTRREVRAITHQCVRIPGIEQAEELIRNRDGWAKFVKLLDSLPSLNHMSFFADASDDTTMALTLASLIAHPSHHTIPQTMPSTPTTEEQLIPIAQRIRSFGWRQRAAPPADLRQFSQSSTFVSTLHLIRHAYKLSFLVLDADMDEMIKDDILVVARELSLREAPIGETPSDVSLMLCGPIKGWDGFLIDLVKTFKGIKELFIDRPLRKSFQAQTSFEDFTILLAPLSELPHLHLLQVGSYTFSPDMSLEIVVHLAKSVPTLLVVGLLGQEGETMWWGIWRGNNRDDSLQVLPLGDGDLVRLETAVSIRRQSSQRNGSIVMDKNV